MKEKSLSKKKGLIFFISALGRLNLGGLLESSLRFHPPRQMLLEALPNAEP